MINKDNTQTDLEFGFGDIGLNSGTFDDVHGNKIGMTGFYNQIPREIGAEGDVKIGQECTTGDFPVIMTFNKIESIDVIIEALQDVKKQMLIKE